MVGRAAPAATEAPAARPNPAVTRGGAAQAAPAATAGRPGGGGQAGPGAAGGSGGSAPAGQTGADGNGGTSGDDGAPGAVQGAAASSPGASAVAADSDDDRTLAERIADQLTYIFFNPRASADPDVGGASGAEKLVQIDVNAKSNNAFDPTVTVTVQPRYGTLTPGEKAGQYVYTPNTNIVIPGISDSFTVTINNGTEAKLTGFLGLVQGWLHTVALKLGVAKPDTIEQQVKVTIPGTGKYGNLANKVWWVQQSYYNCTLMAAAMAVGQVTGTLPTESQMVALAKATDSVVYPGKKMYLHENIEDGVNINDADVLMQKNFGVTAVTTRYGTYDASGRTITAATASDGQRALSDLEAALASGKATMATVNSTVIWTAASDYSPSGTPNYVDLDHELVVIRVDLSNGQVYLNDSGTANGSGMKVPLGAFMNAWQSNDYELTIVSANV